MSFERIKNPGLIVLTLILSACGVVTAAKVSVEPQTYPFDGVKWIAPQVTQGADQVAMLQPTYVISAESRLLLRLENFLEKVNQVSVSPGNTVSVNVDLDSVNDTLLAQTVLKLCPIQRNWMMLATWKRAFPMGRDGMWQTSGGDYNPATCLAVTSVSNSTLTFDVTEWFVNFVKGRQLNYGLILVSSSATPISVKGDGDSYSAPRVSWMW